MGSPPTIEGPSRGFATLDASGRSAWVDLGSLSDYDTSTMLRGEQVPQSLDGWAQSEKPGDLLGTNWPELLLASPRFVDVLRDSSLTGWSCRTPVTVAGLPTLTTAYLFTVTGRCGPVQIPDPLDIGQVLNMATWDGSDFFAAPNVDFVFVSPRATHILRRAKLKNVTLRQDALTVSDD